MEKTALLNLFQSIQAAEPTLGIGEADVAYCECHQALHDAAQDYFDRLQAFVTQHAPAENPYLESAEIDVAKFRFEARKQFIQTIFSYFEGYGVALNTNETLTRYGVSRSHALNNAAEEAAQCLPLHYADIVSEVLSQTGGLSLEDAAIQQLKAKFADSAQWELRGGDRSTVSGATVHIESYLRLEQGYDNEMRISYHAQDQARLLYRTLSLFDTGHLTSRDANLSMLPYYWPTSDREVKLTPYVLPCAKVRSLRFYKNGKVSIKFDASADALTFLRDFCHMEVTQ